MFTSNSVLLFGMIYLLSVVDSLVALTTWNQVLQSTDQLISACYRVNVACDWNLNLFTNPTLILLERCKPILGREKNFLNLSSSWNNSGYKCEKHRILTFSLRKWTKRRLFLCRHSTSHDSYSLYCRIYSRGDTNATPGWSPGIGSFGRGWCLSFQSELSSLVLWPRCTPKLNFNTSAHALWFLRYSFLCLSYLSLFLHLCRNILLRICTRVPTQLKWWTVNDHQTILALGNERTASFLSRKLMRLFWNFTAWNNTWTYKTYKPYFHLTDHSSFHNLMTTVIRVTIREIHVMLKFFYHGFVSVNLMTR
jgi:hypothetical protein